MKHVVPLVLEKEVLFAAHAHNEPNIGIHGVFTSIAGTTFNSARLCAQPNVVKT